jgi:uncharacterized coiled-coil protein SlyX
MLLLSKCRWPVFALAIVAGCGSPQGAAFSPVREAAGTAVEAAGEGQAEGAKRQIIYRATIVLSVPDFGEAEKQLAGLVKTSGGFVAQFREDRPYGSQRGGHWTVRVPVDRFQRFVDDVGKLGVAESREVQSEDITEEYVDLTARLKNKERLEERLLELVANRSDEIKDVIALEAELNRVREEIERLQGRLRYLSDRVQLSTVTITAYERQHYRPPESTLTGRVAQTFALSLESLQQVGEGLLLAAVALAPWVFVLAVATLPAVWGLRRAIKRKRRAGAVVAEAIGPA